jgi:hypothetical protein
VKRLNPSVSHCPLMNNLRKHLKNIPLIQRLATLKITVVCLFLLFVLTFWGTVAQVKEGLYLAQHQFFFSWGFLGFGFLPFPGAKLVLWVLFINLVCVSITRFVYKWSHLGIMIIHIGLLTYFFSAFVTFYATKESNVTLMEGESAKVSLSYHDWEVAIWKNTTEAQKKVYAVDLTRAHALTNFELSDLGFAVVVDEYHKNAQALKNEDDKYKEAKNESGIKSLKPAAFKIEPEKNIPGGVFTIISDGEKQKILLYGAEVKPTRVRIGDDVFSFQLQRKHFQLPFMVTLKKFDMEKYPGTEIAKSYQSLVEITHQKLDREVLIYMNHPLRHKDFTLYQASYSIDDKGRMHSTLAVVQNAGRILPYISSLITFLGLAIHFLMMAFRKTKHA